LTVIYKPEELGKRLGHC